MSVAFNWVIVGGLLCGIVAGAAARFGRLCTMSAIEDALIGHDFRGAKAWFVTLAVAVGTTQILAVLGIVDLSGSLYSSPRLHVFGTVLGGLLFGLGMTFAGTCSFGLLVRAGAGDLRAALTACVVGIVAIAMTAGALTPIREALLGFGMIDLPRLNMMGELARSLGKPLAIAILVAVPSATWALAVNDNKLRVRKRLLLSAVGMGGAVALGWLVTTLAADHMLMDRVESLSFVAPVGRGIAQFMLDAFRNAGFGVALAAGVVIASLTVALWRAEFRWEAFDDAREMRRHLGGGALMGIGGVLAQGCTLGQGLSAASTLSVSAPIFLASLLVGAKFGLMHLIEGRAMWRMGRPH